MAADMTHLLPATSGLRPNRANYTYGKRTDIVRMGDMHTLRLKGSR